MFLRPLRAVFLGLLLSLAGAAATAADLPPGFAENLVIHDLFRPTALDFGPGGELWISGQQGQVWVYRSGALILAAAIPVNIEGERGISGLALDPDYVSNRHVWLYYTVSASPPNNRLSRFTNVADHLVDEAVMVEGPPLQNIFHNGGCIRFAADRTLYFTMGDDGQGSLAQDTHNLRGKVFHINRDGSPAAGNPFPSGVDGDPRVWAYGFRNPWRFAIQPLTGNLFIGDVGAAAWEEVDLGVPGGNFGWPVVEGPVPPSQPGFVYPLFSYPHDPILGAAVIGGDFARPGSFAPEYEGNYFFADHPSGRLFRMRLDVSNHPTSTDVWATGLGLPTELRFGPDGGLYFLAFNAGELRRISYVGGGNRQPVAVGTVTPDNGVAPLSVVFDATGSHDADGDALSFLWSFGDGQSSSQASIAHAYAPGSYTATLTVGDGHGGSNSAPPFHIVSGNQRPRAEITAPADGSGYQPGQLIIFSGAATDPEEGSIPCERFSWKVVLHHLEHTHPFLGPVQGVCQGTFTIPTNLSGHSVMDRDVYFEVNLSAQDTGVPLGPGGILAGTTSVSIRPGAREPRHGRQM
jgi:glucose/arabinose dehydrogenase